MSPHFCFGQHTFLVCLFLMMHTRLNAAYWGFMVCLGEVIRYIKTRWEAAQLKHSANLGNCSICLVIVFPISFYFGCLAYMGYTVCTCLLDFRRILRRQSGFTLFITDSKIRLQVHVSILILARWNLFASPRQQQQQLSQCRGASALSLGGFNAVLKCG